MLTFTDRQAPSSAAGFTLAEVAVVLTIMGLLLGGLLTALPNQIQQQRKHSTDLALGELREALMGHALAHGHLPCPDIDGDGMEDLLVLNHCHTSPADARCASTDGNLIKGQSSDLANQQVCAAQAGRVPHATLAAQVADAWFNRVSYQVDAAFSNHSAAPTLASTASLRVCIDAACSRLIASALPAILVSHGQNGLGAHTSQGTPNNMPVGADELANTDRDALFVSHEPRAEQGLGGEFDDQLSWIPATLLLNRMVAAGLLP